MHATEFFPNELYGYFFNVTIYLLNNDGNSINLASSRAYLSRNIDYTAGATILLLPVAAKSHILILKSIGERLAKKGHSVHIVLRHYDSDNANDARTSGIKPIFFQATLHPEDEEKGRAKQIQEYFRASKNVDIDQFSVRVLEECQTRIEDDVFMNEIRSMNFDLAFVDGLVISPCLTLIPVLLKIPFILVDSIPAFSHVPVLPSFIPIGIKPLTDKMTFSERVFNTAFLTMLMSFPPFTGLKNTTLIQKHLPGISKSWQDLVLMHEMLMITRDHILEPPSPSMPHVVTIACITCKPAADLPSDLEEFVSGAPKGVIIVTFGSVAANFPQKMTDPFFNAFKRIEYRVIWKYPGQEFPLDIPEHIKLMKWLPQNDLLGHKNTKLFITHGGNNGRYESIYHGVPMIAFPMFAEQPHNAQQLKDKKVGIPLDLRTFTTDELVKAIEDILGEEESIYLMNARHLSKIMRSDPMTASEKVVFWTEHILKFGGLHLRSHALDMPLYQVYLLDILAFVVTSLAVVIVASYCLLCYICSKCCGKTSNKIKTN